MPSTHIEENESNVPTGSVKLFFYGTLKRGEPNYELLVERNAKFVTEATTVDTFPLVVATDYNIPFLVNKKGCGKNIQGEIFLVDQATKAFLDEFEGVHTGVYALLFVDVVDKNGNVQSVQAYVLNDYKADILDGKVLFESYSSANPHYGPYLKQCDRPENAGYVKRTIKKTAE